MRNNLKTHRFGKNKELLLHFVKVYFQLMVFWSHLFSQKLPPLFEGRELVLQHLQLLDEAVLLRHLVLVDVQSLQDAT